MTTANSSRKTRELWQIAVVIAFASATFYLVYQKPLGVTEGYLFVNDIMTKDPSLFSNPKNWLVWGIIAGAFLGALSKGYLSKWGKLDKKPKRAQIFLALIGGILMGYGAKIANGCLVGSIMISIPMGSLQGWFFLIFLFPGVLIGIYVIKIVHFNKFSPEPRLPHSNKTGDHQGGPKSG